MYEAIHMAERLAELLNVARVDDLGAKYVFTVTDPGDPAEKRKATALARHVADACGAQWVTLLYEAFVVKTDPARTERLRRRGGFLGGEPDRREVAMASIQLRSGQTAGAIR